MVIMIQKDLQPIKARLEKGGHKVVYSGEYNYPVDAFIYSSSYGGGYSSAVPPFEFRADSMMNFGSGDFSGHGAILEINAVGRSFEEIEDMLLRKRRTDFF